MQNGFYRTTKPINIHCRTLGHLVLAKDVIVKVESYEGYVNNFSFPIKLLDWCEDSIKRLSWREIEELGLESEE